MSALASLPKICSHLLAKITVDETQHSQQAN